jgi:hypothetical protein
MTNEELMTCLRQTILPVAPTLRPNSPTPASFGSCDMEAVRLEALMTDEELMTCLRQFLGIQK